MREVKHESYPWGEVTTVETDDVCAYLSGKYAKLPQGVTVHHNGANVTPTDEAGVVALQQLRGEFQIVEAAGDNGYFLSALYLGLGGAAVMRWIRPDDLEEPRSYDFGSPTNAPGSASNRERIGERVPDQYGYLKSTPDLLAPIVTRYEQGERVEYAYMAITRGSISNAEIYDGGVPIEDITGYSAHLYDPGDKIGDTPAIIVGNRFDMESMAFTIDENATYESIPPAYLGAVITGDTEDSGGVEYGVRFPQNIDDVDEDTPHIQQWNVYTPTVVAAMHNNCPVGSEIDISNVRYVGAPTPPVTPDIAGTYTVVKSNEKGLWLDIPIDKVSDWQDVPAIGTTYYQRFTLDILPRSPILEFRTKGRSFVDVTLEAPNGLHYIPGQKYGGGDNTPTDDVVVQFMVTALWNPDGGAVWYPTSQLVEFRGNSAVRTGATARLYNPLSDKLPYHDIIVEIRRLDEFRYQSPATNYVSGSVGRVDLVSIAACHEPWEAYYDTAPDISTLLTRTVNTYKTRSLGSRKVEVLCSRDVGHVSSYGTNPDSNPVNILCNMITDDAIGRLSTSAYDVASLDAAYAAVRSQMGAASLDFAHVFDKSDTSFEEMITALASSIFCNAYRIGQVIHFRPIVPQIVPTLLFNCRNKIPDSESRVISFGVRDNVDSVIQKYLGSELDVSEKLELEWPVEGDTQKSSGVIGLSSKDHAFWHASRLYYRNIYNRVSTSFEATEEAALLLPGDMIMVTNGTHKADYEGDLISVDVTGKVLGLSIPVTLDSAKDYVIFLQSAGGFAQSYRLVNVSTGETQEVETQYAPGDVNVDVTTYARTTFSIVEDMDSGFPVGAENQFIVDNVSPTGDGTFTVDAFRYDPRVYQNDGLSAP